MTWSKAKELVVKKQVRVAGQPTSDPAQRLKVGNRVEVHGFSPVQTAPTGGKRSKLAKPAPVHDGPMPDVVYEDVAVVVVNKPAGLTTMRHADEADEFGLSQRLLTLPASPTSVAVRRWFLSELIGQLHGKAPVAWSDSRYHAELQTVTAR